MSRGGQKLMGADPHADAPRFFPPQHSRPLRSASMSRGSRKLMGGPGHDHLPANMPTLILDLQSKSWRAA